MVIYKGLDVYIEKTGEMASCIYFGDGEPQQGQAVLIAGPLGDTVGVIIDIYDIEIEVEDNDTFDLWSREELGDVCYFPAYNVE